MVTAISTTGAFIVVTFTQMVFGELVPKNWAIAQPMRVADLVVRPQNVFMFLFGWLVRFLNGSANMILRWLGFTPEEEVASARTAEELSSLVRRSALVVLAVATSPWLVALAWRPRASLRRIFLGIAAAVAVLIALRQLPLAIDPEGYWSRACT